MRCLTIDMSTVITIGEEDAGATVFLSSANKLTPEWVRIRNVDGFSGDYDRGLEGNAFASTTGTTYDISGTARGYGVESYLPVTKKFAVKVSC